MRLQIITIQILLALLFVYGKQTQAQELSATELKQIDFSKPISFVRGDSNDSYIVFSNPQTKSILKKYDIRANNPFKSIGKKTDDPYYDIYELENKRFSDIFPNFNFEPYYHKERLSDTMKVDQVSVRYNSGFSNNGRYAAASYSLKTVLDVGRTLFIVFDSTGVEISRFNLDVIPNVIDLTDNGKYLSLFYDGWSMYFHESIKTSGVMIVSIDDSKVIVKKEIQNLSGIGKNEYLIFAGTKGYYNNNGAFVKKRWYFDLARRKVYSRELDMDCLGKSILVEDGIIMNCLDGTSYKLTFLEDFTVEDLLW